MFVIINKLLHHLSSSPLPMYDDPTKLANSFADFFESKVLKIHAFLSDDNQSWQNQYIIPEPEAKVLLGKFEPVTFDDVAKILSKSPNKSCPLDQIPAKIFASVSNSLLPMLTLIVNLSLELGKVPTSLKEAMINPILKKPSLDRDTLNNHGPVSNLPFISKLIELVVCGQIVAHLDKNNLSEKYQSAYRQHPSTETALTAVLNDLLTSLDQKKAVFLIILDLSAAFDTVDHKILLNWLKHRIGIRNMTYDWMESYLSGRHQFVSVAGPKSGKQNLVRGSLRDQYWAQCFFPSTPLPWVI